MSEENLPQDEFGYLTNAIKNQMLSFRYANGAMTAGSDSRPVVVWGDPIRIHRRLVRALNGDPNRVIKMAADPEPEVDTGVELTPEEAAAFQLRMQMQNQMRLSAQEELIAAIREAFDMVPFDPVSGSGATEWHCRNAFNRYLDYSERQKKNGA